MFLSNISAEHEMIKWWGSVEIKVSLPKDKEHYSDCECLLANSGRAATAL